MVLLSDTAKSATALDVKVANHVHYSSILQKLGKEHQDQDLVDFGVRLEEQVNESKKAKKWIGSSGCPCMKSHDFKTDWKPSLLVKHIEKCHDELHINSSHLKQQLEPPKVSHQRSLSTLPLKMCSSHS
jgi:hypothetical protein